MGLSAVVATPAHATILGDVAVIKGLVEQFEKEYDAVIGYITKGKQQTELDKIRAIVAATETSIVNEIDAVATGQLQGKCDTAVEQFQSINTMDASQLANLVTESVECVSTAKNLINSESSLTAVDADSIALNAVAPIALVASAKANQNTGLLTQFILDGNNALLKRLKPTCGGSPDEDVHALTEATIGPVPGTGGEAPIPGHGACYNYTVPAPTPIHGDVIVFPEGKGTGKLPWKLTGDGQAEFCAEVFHCADKVTWPEQSDYSIAINQAMAATSYPIAQTTLGKLAPAATPVASPIAITVPAQVSQIDTPMPVFKVDAAGALYRGTITPKSNFADVSFSGWTKVSTDGTPSLTSVSSVATWDGRYQVFGLDRIGRLFTQWQQKPHDDSTWSAWAQLDGTFNSVSVARNQNGNLQLFTTDSSGKIQTRTQVLNGDYHPKQAPVGSGSIHPGIDTWTPWQTMDGGLTQIAAITDADKKIELYGVNVKGETFRRMQDKVNGSDFSVPGNWAPNWTQLGNAPAGMRSIAASMDLGDQPNVFGTVAGDALYHMVVAKNSWEKVTGSVHDIAAAMGGGGAGRIYVMGRDAAGNDLLNSTDGIPGDSWSGWFCNMLSGRICSTHTKPYVAYRTTGNHLGSMTPDGVGHDAGVGVMPGTSPASVKVNGGVETAFVGSDGFLYQVAPNQAPVKSGPVTGLVPAAGTSPSIASDGHGLWEIAIMGGDTHIWTVDSFGTVTKTGAVVKGGGTSPSITFVPAAREFDPNAGFWVAFQGTDGFLWKLAPDGGSGWAGAGLCVVPGTSPSIASAGVGNWKIAFHACGDHLWTYDSGGHAIDTGAVIHSGTSSPTIAPVVDSGYWVAFQGTDGFLWKLAPGGGFGWAGPGLGVAANTTPSIAGDDFGGWEIAFHAQGDHLWTFESAGNATDTMLMLPSGANPALAIGQG